MASTWFLTTAVAVITGCNSLLGNDERVLDDTIDTMPDRARERDSSSDGPTAAQGDGGADADGDADADADASCPPPACTTSGDCPANELCFGVSDGETDGGGLTRFCAAACDASSTCASDRQCAGAQSPQTMHCAPKAPVCGRACNHLCGLSCVDLATDKLNCGSCGSACPAAKACKSGVCS